jgi:hypothetical protein
LVIDQLEVNDADDNSLGRKLRCTRDIEALALMLQHVVRVVQISSRRKKSFDAKRSSIGQSSALVRDPRHHRYEARVAIEAQERQPAGEQAVYARLR